MLFKLMARKGDEAYVEIIKDVIPVGGRFFCIPESGVGFFADVNEIYDDEPEIIHKVGSSMLKIKWKE